MMSMSTSTESRFNTQRRAPSSSSLIWELPRVLSEVSRLGFSWPILLRQAPPGDGHPVMVLPGFLGGDDSTLILRQFLTRLGYATLPWLHGRNVGNPHQFDGALLRFYRAHQKSGRENFLDWPKPRRHLCARNLSSPSECGALRYHAWQPVCWRRRRTYRQSIGAANVRATFGPHCRRDAPTHV